MKFIFRILFVFTFSMLSCLADPVEEIQRELECSINNLQKITQKLANLEEGDYNAYRGKEQKRGKSARQQFQVDLFTLAHNQLHDVFTQTPWKEVTPETLHTRLLFPHCRGIYLLKAFYEEQLTADPHSEYLADLYTGIKSLSIYEKYFSPEIEYCVSFLKIQPLKKNSKNIMTYSVVFKTQDVHFLHCQEAQSLLNYLELSQLSRHLKELSLPNDYAYAVQKQLENTKKMLQQLIDEKKSTFRYLSNKKQDFDIDLANTEVKGIAFHGTFDNKQILEQQAKFIFDPLKYTITDIDNNGQQIRYSLNSTEKQHFSSILKEKITASVSLVEEDGQKKSGIRKQKKGKGKRKGRGKGKSKKGITRKQRGTEERRKISEEPQTPDTSLHSGNNGEESEEQEGEEPINEANIQAPSHPSEDKEEDTDKKKEKEKEEPTKEANIQAPSHLPKDKEEDKEKEKEKEREEAIPQTLESDEASAEFTLEWLKKIMNDTKGQEKFFALYHKAYSLHDQLTSHRNDLGLLLQIQEATFNLATYAQHLESQSVSASLTVPEKLEGRFRFFMFTPTCYLKGALRMGFVHTLFKNLGIAIDIQRHGSCVHFKYGNHHTSIHIHDKENGKLDDGGTIESLKKFLFDIGWK